MGPWLRPAAMMTKPRRTKTARPDNRLPVDADAGGVLRLSAEDQRRIAQALVNPPEPSASLRRAFDRRRELLAVDEESERACRPALASSSAACA